MVKRINWRGRASIYLGVPQVEEVEFVVSRGCDTHLLTYFQASVFVRDADDFVSADRTSFEALMNAAATAQLQACSRVGAAVLGSDSEIYAATEVPVGAAFDSQIFRKMSGVIERLGVECALAASLVDCSTSIHAECVALQDCMDAGARPLILATTRCPCLACCRHIRLTGVRKVVYLSGKGFGSPGVEVLELLRFALGGCDLMLYEGKGGLA